MILHCEICSQGGERMNTYSQVAKIREDLIRLPLSPEMFEAVDDRERIPPWAPGCDWIWMKCPWHHGPWWMTTEERAVRAMEDGGPSRILTDEGWIELDRSGIREGFRTAIKAPPLSILSMMTMDLSRPIPRVGDHILGAIKAGMARGLTHTQIAERLGITRQKVTRILRDAGAYDG